MLGRHTRQGQDLIKGQVVGPLVLGCDWPGHTALPQKAPGVLCPSQLSSILQWPFSLSVCWGQGLSLCTDGKTEAQESSSWREHRSRMGLDLLGAPESCHTHLMAHPDRQGGLCPQPPRRLQLICLQHGRT